jgi:Protein of unknown function (DUF1553)/Protein of unknown function (DUF1549)/Planctomycete cytochrome C
MRMRFALSAAGKQSRSLMAKPLLFLLMSIAVSAAADSPLPERPRYNRDVRPILADACFRCHGFDRNTREGDRRLDTREGALADNAGTKAIVPGKPDESELLKRILTTDEDDIMPPHKEARQLTEREKQLLRRWIEQGAEYEAHWAFIPPVKPAVPKVEGASHVIDAFIQTRLAALKLEPAPKTDRVTLARRLYLDLTGLPPSPQDVETFVQDTAPDAVARLADRLLASPQFGERMAVWWLDQTRYADTIGYHSDNPMPVSPWRDYVIRSFNENKPFDRFTIEQLAGDLLPEKSQEQLVASAYNRLILSTEEGGAQAGQYEAKYLVDRVKSVGTTWLGQTYMCAECHDHKYDPVTTRDFYALGAFFADVDEVQVGKRGDGMWLFPSEDIRREHSEVIAHSAPLEAAVKEKKATEEHKAELAALKKRRSELEAGVERCLVTTATSHLRTVRILPRGDWQNTSGEVLLPATPAYLPEAISSTAEQRRTRLDLARWLVSPRNPLTARVQINRIWKLLYGTGIVRTLDDMGTQSELPDHQPLLDWLACEFMERGWDLKYMVRLLVTSHTYALSSSYSAEALARDPQNREFARGGRWRLDAEFVRDNALAISGLLVRRSGGPSVKPYQPAGYWENLNFPTREWDNSKDDNQWRRGLYTWWQRSYVQPSMLAFDAPTREECAPDRTRSNIPQQALVLLNDLTYVEAARVFAARIISEGGADDPSRLKWAWKQATLREPAAEELTTLAALLGTHRAKFHLNPKAAAETLKAGYAKPAGLLNAPEHAAWMSVSRVILNLHETITRP